MKILNVLFPLVILLAAAAFGTARGQDSEEATFYPDPTRFEGDVAAFEAEDALAFPPSGAWLYIGSSSMRMWHETIAKDLAPLVVIPRGFGGSTMLDVLYFAGRIVLPYRPSDILLYEGDNDIDFGVPPEQVSDVFGAFVLRVRGALPETRIHLLSIKPSIARWDKWPAMEKANALMAAQCAADSLLQFIDVATPMLGPDGKPRPELFLEDGLHMNAAGYAVWTGVVREALGLDAR
ncbi:MAG: SGNH/GDSL hydrolase family protein [bacterium]